MWFVRAGHLEGVPRRVAVPGPQFPSVDGVRFVQEGDHVEVPTDVGLVGGPVTAGHDGSVGPRPVGPDSGADVTGL